MCGVSIQRNKRKTCCFVMCALILYFLYKYTTNSSDIEKILSSVKRHAIDVPIWPNQWNPVVQTSSPEDSHKTVLAEGNNKPTAAGDTHKLSAIPVTGPVISGLGGSVHSCKVHQKSKLVNTVNEFVKIADRPVFVFSAFYDSRAAAGGPLIRILASGLQAEYNKIGPFHCVLWYDDIADGIEVSAEYERIYQSTLHHDEYTAHFLKCKLNISLGIPVNVSVVGDTCQATERALRVEKAQQTLSKKTAGMHTFGLCVSPIYGRYDDMEDVIEFIEIHRILGVSRFTFYDVEVGARVMRALESYKKDGLVQIIPWNFPRNVHQNYFMQRESLNDCLYRNMGYVDFLAVNDLDEIFVPRNMSFWSPMMDRLSSPQVGAYLFQHVYFRRNTTGPAPHLMTQTSFSRVNKAMPPGKIRCKSLYEPVKALKIDIHFPYQLLPGFREKLVDEDVAVLHHYRLFPMAMFEKESKDFRFIRDEYMTRYKTDLLKAFTERMKLLS